MIKFKEKNLMILDENGDIMPFQIEELEHELVECFYAANQASDSPFAEDIVLALDYVLHEENNGSLYSIVELRENIKSLLTESGFAEIADIYCKKANFIEPLYSTSSDSIKKLLLTKVYFPATNIDFISKDLSEKFANCHISNAPLGLIVEMAKFVNILSANLGTELQHTLNITTPKAKKGYYIKESSLNLQLAEKNPIYFDNKVFHVGGISKIHSSIKIHLNLLNFASLQSYEPPVTELYILNDFACISSFIDDIYSDILLAYNGLELSNDVKNPLPLYLYFDDIFEFSQRFFISSSQKTKKLSKELSELISNSLKSPLYKVFLS